jgi:hypothetical protein
LDRRSTHRALRLRRLLELHLLRRALKVAEVLLLLLLLLLARWLG